MIWGYHYFWKHHKTPIYLSYIMTWSDHRKTVAVWTLKIRRCCEVLCQLDLMTSRFLEQTVVSFPAQKREWLSRSYQCLSVMNVFPLTPGKPIYNAIYRAYNSIYNWIRGPSCMNGSFVPMPTMPICNFFYLCMPILLQSVRWLLLNAIYVGFTTVLLIPADLLPMYLLFMPVGPVSQPVLSHSCHHHHHHRIAIVFEAATQLWVLLETYGAKHLGFFRRWLKGDKQWAPHVLPQWEQKGSWMKDKDG